MVNVLRWGRSAYETAEQLNDEVERLAALGCEVRHHVGEDPPVEDCRALVLTSKVRVDGAILDRAPELGLVVTTTSGHEHIDVVACEARGVAVARCPLARRDAVVDTALGMALALLRDLPSLHSRAREGIWARSELPDRPMRRVRGLPVGIVGHGVIGARAAQVWRALGAQVWVSDPRMKGSPQLAELIEECALLSLHCDLNPTTRNLLSAEVLWSLNPETIVINTARGALIDVDALLERDLRVGLDVFPDEPYPRLAELAARPNTLLTPHAAGYHRDLGRSLAAELALTVRAFIRGEPLPHPVSTS